MICNRLFDFCLLDPECSKLPDLVCYFHLFLYRIFDCYCYYFYTILPALLHFGNASRHVRLSKRVTSNHFRFFFAKRFKYTSEYLGEPKFSSKLAIDTVTIHLAGCYATRKCVV